MDYEKLTDVAMDIGEVMLKHGAETYRVEDTLRRILGCANGCERDAYVVYTGIFVTLGVPGRQVITKVRRIENEGSNYNKIYLANNLSRELCDGHVTLEEAQEEIDRIRGSRIYSGWTIAVSTVLVSAMFAPLFGGSIGDCLVAGINGILIVLGRKLSLRLQLPDFICNLFISILIAFLTRFILITMHISGLNQSIIITSSIMPLVPGVAITNAIRDTLQGDYMSGGSRALEAFVTATGIAVGIGIGLILHEMVGG